MGSRPSGMNWPTRMLWHWTTGRKANLEGQGHRRRFSWHPSCGTSSLLTAILTGPNSLAPLSINWLIVRGNKSRRIRQVLMCGSCSLTLPGLMAALAQHGRMHPHGWRPFRKLKRWNPLHRHGGAAPMIWTALVLHWSRRTSRPICLLLSEVVKPCCWPVRLRWAHLCNKLFGTP